MMGMLNLLICLTFLFRSVNTGDIYMGFRKINSNSIGTDGLSKKFIKVVLPFIINPILDLFNTIIMTSTFPDV